MAELSSIPGFPSHYRVCPEGFVWSDRSRGSKAIPWRRMKAYFNKDKGYFYVNVFFEGGRHRSISVHTLVATAFHGPRPEGMECRHLDGDSTNNLPSNLAWGTRSENQLDRRRHGTHRIFVAPNKGKDNPNAKLTEAQVREIRSDFSEGVPLRVIASRLGIHVTTAKGIAERRFWKHLV